MKNLIPKINENYFGSFSRDGLKAIKYMVEKWPKKKTFTNEEIGKAIKMKGKSLGGVLGSFSKRDNFFIVIKVGMISIGWSGKKFSRPKQVWALNPKLKNEHIQQIREVLNNFLLDI